MPMLLITIPFPVVWERSPFRPISLFSGMISGNPSLYSVPTGSFPFWAIFQTSSGGTSRVPRPRRGDALRRRRKARRTDADHPGSADAPSAGCAEGKTDPLHRPKGNASGARHRRTARRFGATRGHRGLSPTKKARRMPPIFS